jgi:cutinase
MTSRSVARIVAGAPLMVFAFLTAPASGLLGPTASADDCPNAEVVFARGTGEPVGPGGPGQAFYDALTSQLPGKTINLYPVNYPSTADYVNSAHAGADDEVAHVQATAASCPNTKIVLGGYSQGAGVADMTSHRLSPQVANHVAPKTIDICLPNDNICAEGGSIIAHLGYVPDATNQAATFVAGKL